MAFQVRSWFKYSIKNFNSCKMVRKQLFLSHSWKCNMHEKIRALNNELQKIGWSTWFDENDMQMNIDMSMVEGIEQSDAVVACINRAYVDSVNHASKNMRTRSNVNKEWTYSHARNKIVLPIMFEKFDVWPFGVVTMYLGNQLYIDATHGDVKKIASDITEVLQKHFISPSNKKNMRWKSLFWTTILCSQDQKKRNIKVLGTQRRKAFIPKTLVRI